jgi:CDGSH-type Zn-finger protein
VIDAFHAGCFTRYLNHSCHPNCVIIPVVYGEATADTPYLGFYTRTHVKEGEGLEFSYKGVPDEEQFTNLARAARFRKKKKRAIAAGQKFDTTSALCQCGANNCDGSMWQWEHEKNEDEGENPDDGMEVNVEEGQMRSIGVLDDPEDGEYEDTDTDTEDEVDQLESDDEVPLRIEMV